MTYTDDPIVDEPLAFGAEHMAMSMAYERIFEEMLDEVAAITELDFPLVPFRSAEWRLLALG